MVHMAISLTALASTWTLAASIGCFRCQSVNGSDVVCEDEFDGSTSYYTPYCTAVREGRRGGFFPAQYCFKIDGRTSTSSLVIRGCSVDALGGDMCGQFVFDKVQYRGCIHVCQTDGCNYANISLSKGVILVGLLLTTAISNTT